MKLAAGLILIVLSVIHVIYGEKMQVSILKQTGVDRVLIGSYRVMSLQGGLFLLAGGAIELLSYTGLLSLTGFTAFVPMGMIAINLIGFLVVSVFKHQELLKLTVPQLVIFGVVLGLQIGSV